MNQPAVPATDLALDAVRLRRAELHESIDRTRRALDVDRPAVLHVALSALADDVAAHVEVTEGAGGLHQAIVAGDPRLANAVAALTAEHHTVAAALASLLVDTEPPYGAHATVDRDVAERCTRLIEVLIRHRQRGADLVHEAFNTDLGDAG